VYSSALLSLAVSPGDTRHDPNYAFFSVKRVNDATTVLAARRLGARRGIPGNAREALAYRSHESVLMHVQNPGVSLTPPPGRVPTARPLPGWV
jgi:hypothetical protein